MHLLTSQEEFNADFTAAKQRRQAELDKTAEASKRMAEISQELGLPPGEGQGPGGWTRLATDETEDSVLAVKVRSRPLVSGRFLTWLLWFCKSFIHSLYSNDWGKGREGGHWQLDPLAACDTQQTALSLSRRSTPGLHQTCTAPGLDCLKIGSEATARGEAATAKGYDMT